MGRKRIAEETKVISIRLPIETIELLDDYANSLRNLHPGVNVTRTDAARAIIIRALALATNEAENAQ